MKRAIGTTLIWLAFALWLAGCGSADKQENKGSENMTELAGITANMIGCDKETALDLLEDISSDTGEITAVEVAG